MPIGTQLIERGYLPVEMPPCFSTSEFAAYVNAAGGITALTSVIPSGGSSRPARHNLARPAGMRRVLSVTNPVHFLRVAEAFDAHWDTAINPLLTTTTIGSSRPTFSLGPRCLAPAFKDEALERRARARSGQRYLLKADIQNFYPSIYTHSIPWVLHGKKVAKANKHNASLAGNALDKALRDGQDGQTIGIPIGCDSSWAVAECLMAYVEEELRAAIDPLSGYRNYDDFELAFPSLSAAEQGMGILQEILATIELTLNPRKTCILELPLRIEDAGVAELRSWKLRTTQAGQRTDLVAFFDRLADLVAAERGGHIASYAVARLRYEPVLPSSWEVLEAELLTLLVAEPYAAKQVCMTLSMLTAAGHKASVARVAEAVERLIERHAPLGHGSEVCWALWLAVAFGAPLSQHAANRLSNMSDPFVALIALHADQLKLFQGTLDVSTWEAEMTADGLRGPLWILSYEARHRGWLPTKGGGNHLATDPLFGQIHAAGVSFFVASGFVLTHQPTQFPSPSAAAFGVGGGGYPS